LNNTTDLPNSEYQYADSYQEQVEEVGTHVHEYHDDKMGNVHSCGTMYLRMICERCGDSDSSDEVVALPPWSPGKWHNCHLHFVPL